ncbi:hypothetical protein SAMN04487857_107185 [Pseudomonas sp. ok272]|uniref:J domain-containing protein n=1 Tax=unclassified Pseudomonas TaxID=196821 RepID=UPI0008BD5FC4|nr:MULTISPECIES: J domain-containing protein [unclassified Pseudomonas]SEM95274.1 hypothetical protein SAMN04487857_107185 [Pseudomonas sp. ok272]SFM93089.1 hypothetical protein SAMN04487858_10931 [Pseudomonas sp. ok602]
MKKTTLDVSIGGADKNPKKLTAGQRKFNGLVKKIDKQRQILLAWEAATPLYTERWHREFLPQLDILHQQSIEFVQVLSDLGERIKLSKTDRKTLTQEICGQAYELIEAGNCSDADQARLKVLYHQHSGRDFDTDEADDNELFNLGLQEMFGVDLGDNIGRLSPEDIAQKISERFDAEQPESRQKPGKKTAQQLRQETDAAQASQSVREVYRKLASALHPDREPDPVERERKTALMQRVNHAYGNRNLLELLQLQLELEHISADTLNTLAADRLKHYNRVLSEQLLELQQEAFDQELAFKQQFDVDPYIKVAPQNVAGIFEYQLEQVLLEIQDRTQLYEELNDPKALKAWLKGQRDYDKALEREMARGFDEDMFFDDFDDPFTR